MNVHEFLTYQSLLSGTSLRWPQLLIELGSANLNLSTEITAMIISHLALKAGPPHASSNPLGAVHIIFQDSSFCRRLRHQLGERLEGISSNYRETICMETLITLILRLASLGTEVGQLLLTARSITVKWMTGLRDEIQNATNVEVSRNLSRYALWAAILCRRTFAIYAEFGHPDADAMSCFVVSSITLQDNLVSDPQGLPQMLKNALIRDLKAIHRLKTILRDTLQHDPTCLITAISAILPNFITSPQAESSNDEEVPVPTEHVDNNISDTLGNSGKDFPGFSVMFLTSQYPDQWWIQIKTKATSVTFSQTIHFHLLEGHFFVGGKPINKLPASYRNSVVLEELFGDESLLTWPSNLPGMEYQLAINKKGHQIHLGKFTPLFIYDLLLQTNSRWTWDVAVNCICLLRRCPS